MNDYEEMVEINIADFLAKWFKDLKNHVFKMEVTNQTDTSGKVVEAIAALSKEIKKMEAATKKVEVTNAEKEDYSELLSALKNVEKAVKAIPQPEKTENVKVTNLGEINFPEFPAFPKFPEIKIPEVKFPKTQKVEGDVAVSNLKQIIDGLQVVVDAINDMKLEMVQANKEVSTAVVATTRGGKSDAATGAKQDQLLAELQSKADLTETQPVAITTSDTHAIDAFGRLRVSNPITLFDSKNIFNDDGLADNVENQPLFYDNQQTSGSGTSTSYDGNQVCQTLHVSANTSGTRVRQTKMRFNYQPGKSQLVILTFCLNGLKNNIIKREGLFDANDGLFLETSGTSVFFVRRTSTSGTPSDNRVAQASWNLDSMDGNGASGISLDWSKTQIMYFDYEWLGVGRVRMGFVVAGKIYYAHEFLNSNVLDVVYMKTPNLPLRSEIFNNGSGGADSITQICSTVISEGGSQDLGVVRYASTAGTHLDANTEDTVYALIGIRLKSEYIGASVKLLNAALQVHTASEKLEWIIKFNPTVAGTFNYVDQTNSAVQVARGATANTVTGGVDIAGGFIESGGVQAGAAGSVERGIDNALLLGSTIAGVVDTLVLCVRPIAGSTDVDIEGSLTWRELV